MSKNTNEKLNEFLENIKQETYAKNGGYVKLSDISSAPLDEDVNKRVSKLLEDAKLPNGYIDLNALIYDLNGVLYSETSEIED